MAFPLIMSGDNKMLTLEVAILEAFFILSVQLDSYSADWSVSLSEDKNMVLLKVAKIAAFLFYRYKFLSRVKDKNLYRLP
ncbi:hypothetical protein PAEVO_16050 [Paenibacillus sp. GM2FR]|nr:hypothetical protein PAEVO_16050 [Paenibacillus sp. GM2FR]